MLELTNRQLTQSRLRAQWLIAPPGPARPDVAAAVRQVGGTQAQDLPAALLGVRARTRGLTAAQVEAARVDTRAITRTWGMRGTLHLVPSEDLAWLLPLLGPAVIAASRTRRAQLGWDEERTTLGLRTLREVCGEHGPRTREQLRAALEARGLPSAGQALPHLLLVAAFNGVICEGPALGSQPSYVLLDDWLGVPHGDPLPRDAALAELAHRHLRAFGPATVADFAAWAGISLRDARSGWEAIRTQTIDIATPSGDMRALEEDRPAFNLPAPRSPSVALLPRFDTYLLGYRDRSRILETRHAAWVYPGGGILNATLLLDGVIRGTWRIDRAGQQLRVTVRPFRTLGGVSLRAVERGVTDVGRFLGRDTALTVEPPVEG